MKILNLDGHYFVEPLKKMGHEVLWIGPFAECDIHLSETLSLAELLAIFEKRRFHPDLIIWADICKPPSVIGIENLPCITVGYSIDQYCNPWHPSYSAAFDLMLVAQKDYLPFFEEEHLSNRIEWAPLFCNPLKDKDFNQERDIPTSFVGTVSGTINAERKKFLDAFKQQQPLFVTQGNYVPIYNRSKIVLNQSAVGELNFRIFETMACGAAALTEETENGLCDLFTNGEDILLYPRGNPIAAAAVAKAALSSPKLAELAQNGKRKVISQHSSTARARHILNVADQLLSQGPTWRRQNLPVVQKRIANAFNIIAIDDQLPLTQNLHEFFADQSIRLLAESEK